MSLLIAGLLVFAAGCGQDETPAAPSDDGGAGKAMDTAKDAADDATNKEATFQCADPNCTKTKTGKLGDPPS